MRMQKRLSPSLLLRPLLRRSTALSLRWQVALVIGVLSFLPNLIMALMLFTPYYQRDTGAATALALPFLLWLLLVAGLSAGIGYVLSYYLLSPLTKLTAQVTELQGSSHALGNLSLKTDTRDPEEVAALRDAFQRLLEQASLEQSRRSSFVATLMHDLKTPLIAGNHVLAVIRDTDALSREERISLVSQILTENQRLLELVQKLVDAYKFEREGVSLRKQPADLRALARAVTERVQPLAKERQLEVGLEGEGHAEADIRELERALYNLVVNALRYARSSVTITVSDKGLWVRDDGPGLPGPLEKLAQPFNAQPIEIAGKRYTAGTGGLGLFIARRVIEAHGGKLELASTGTEGTVLGLVLP